MKELKIKVPQGHEIDTEKSNIYEGRIVFRKKERELPNDIQDVRNRRFYIDSSGEIIYVSVDAWVSKTFVSTKQRAIALQKLRELLELRDEWNAQWDVDWNEPGPKSILNIKQGNWLVETGSIWNKLFYFRTEKMATRFLEEFDEPLEIIKPIFTNERKQFHQ